MGYRPPKGVRPPQLEGKRTGRPKGSHNGEAAAWKAAIWGFERALFDGAAAVPNMHAWLWWTFASRFPEQVEEFLREFRKLPRKERERRAQEEAERKRRDEEEAKRKRLAAVEEQRRWEEERRLKRERMQKKLEAEAPDLAEMVKAGTRAFEAAYANMEHRILYCRKKQLDPEDARRMKELESNGAKPTAVAKPGSPSTTETLIAEAEALLSSLDALEHGQPIERL